jgi:hypothetical protein
MEEATTLVVPQQPTEHREAYGSAKTENLSDSGWWQILLPLVVIGGCLAFIAIPLMFLTPLLIKSFDPANPANVDGHPLTWLWIVMILLTLTLDAVIIRGLLKVFFTQAGNYR